METEKYEFQIEGDQLVAVHRIVNNDKFEVPLRGDDPLFCKALTWASQNKNEFIAAKLAQLALSPQEEHFCFYCDTKKLVGDLKQRSSFLHAERPPGSWQTNIGSVGIVTINVRVNSSPDQLIFFRLARVVPNEEGFGIGNPLPILISQQLLIDLTNQLSKETDRDPELECLFCRQVERTFVYVDISAFSQLSEPQQLLTINALIKLVRDDAFWPRVAEMTRTDPRNHLEASLCIGDGYIFVFQDPSSATYFAAYLANLIEGLIAHNWLRAFHFRMSVHTGMVYRFWDRFGGQDSNDGRWNYIGRGITDGERVLSAIGKDRDDVVFISAETRMKIRANGDPRRIMDWFENRGTHKDKHGQGRRVYEVNHANTNHRVDHAIKLYQLGYGGNSPVD